MSDAVSLKSRLTAELRLYAWVSFYLFICFSVILIYEASQSASQDASALGIGAALVKALVLGKFILIGEMLKPGTRIGAPTLLHRVAWRSLGMLAVLAGLKLIEELILGLFDGKGLNAIIDELFAQSWLSLLGPLLLMLLVLIPLMVAIELSQVIGEDALRQALLGRREAEDTDKDSV